MASFLSSVVGVTMSAALTALGLIAAYRSGMRVWIGEGVNQARTLFLGMLLVGFSFLVLGPMCIWLSGRFTPGQGNPKDGQRIMLSLFGCMIAASVIIMLILDWISDRVIADRPGKFGPKVPTVGKCNT